MDKCHINREIALFAIYDVHRIKVVADVTKSIVVISFYKVHNTIYNN